VPGLIWATFSTSISRPHPIQTDALGFVQNTTEREVMLDAIELVVVSAPADIQTLGRWLR